MAVELYVQRETRPPGSVRRPVPVRPAARELEAVARRAGDVEMTQIPAWRCLLVRTWPENGEPDEYDFMACRWPVITDAARAPPAAARAAREIA